MPRTSKEASRVKKNSRGNSDWQGFVDIAQDTAEIEDMKTRFPGSPDDILLCMYELLKAGYKVTFGNPHAGESFTASVTGKHPENPNYGFTASAYGGTPEKALWAVYYKVAVTAQWGVWANLQLELPDHERWG